ncbi:MAG: hypothetical protein WBQ65_03970 [Bryobacteraceae bacterium]
MTKVELNKSIEARKLNQRTGLPLTGPEATIPYGAIIEHLETDRDQEKFHYLGELYSCRHEVFVSAVNPAAPAAPAPQTAPGEPVASKLQWEPLDSRPGVPGPYLLRAKVPGGWLVALGGASVTFYPDPEHRWDGSSVA